MYILASGLSKVGVGLVLHRLSSGADMTLVRVILIAAMGVMSVVTLAIAVMFGLQCRPLSAAWGESLGTCMPPTTIGQAAIALSAIDVAVSWLFAVSIVTSSKESIECLTVYSFFPFSCYGKPNCS